MEVLFGYQLTRVAGIAALALAVWASYIYTRNMLTAGTRPSCPAWLVLGFVSLTAAIIHHDASATWDEQIIPIFYAVVPFFYLVLVWKLDGKWEYERLDIICIALALSVWVVWILSHIYDWTFFKVEGSLSLIVLVDFIGVGMLIKHAYHGEEYENRWAWLITAFVTPVNAFSVSDWHSAQFIYPGYLALVMPIVFFFTWFKPAVRKIEQAAAYHKHSPARMAPRRRVQPGQ